jgi:uncharacterized membrane protein
VRGVRKLLGAIFPLLLIGGFAVIGQVWGDTAEGTGGDKSFTLEAIDVRANLTEEGVLQVRERVTYDFDGTFNVGTRDFDEGPWQISRIRAFEGDEPLDTLVQSDTLFEWELGGASGEHTYELRYQVRNAVIAWPDVVELNWQWVGDNVPVGVDRHEVTLRVPGGGEGVRAWAHGPLNGTIDVDGAIVHTEIDDLASYTFLETRVIAPRGRFGPDLPPGIVGQTEPGDYDTLCADLRNTLEAQEPPLGDAIVENALDESGLCEIPDDVETEPQQERIIAEETALAEEANDERAAYAAEQERKQDLKRNLNLATPFVLVGGILLAFLIWRAWGKEPELPAEVEYWRELPDDPPAVAQAILEWGYVDTDAFSTTVVDLAQRGYLTIEDRENDHLFLATDKAPDGLLDFERKVLKRLFGSGNESSQKQLTTWAKAHRTDAANWLESFKTQVTKVYEAKGYQETGRALPWLLYLLVVLGVGGFGVVAFVNDAWFAGGAAVGTAIVILVNIVLLRRRTDAGAQRHAEWEGLKRFLKDFSQLQDAPSGHMALYERYLVAAVALGVSDELIEALRVKIPEVADDPNFASWYVGSRVAGVGAFSGLGDFSSGLSSATASSFRPPPSSSSSSGGGFSGGFSGGGGGGGGGGGFGAR